jgi:TonB-linked SusC/RagA family outer membrane protein
MNKSKPIQGVLLAIMRVTLTQSLLMVLFTSLVSAAPVESRGQGILDRTVSIDVEDEEIKSVLLEIERQTSVAFTYRPRLIKASRKVSLHVENMKIGEVLEQLLDPDISLLVINESEEIVLRSSPNAGGGPIVVANSIIVNGVVRDEGGQPLPGVNITIKGTTKGTVTDSNGGYIVEVPSPETILVFSFVGYTSQEITVGAQTSIDVVMFPDVTSLSEVVVVGYGEQKKENLTGSVVAVNGEDIIKRQVGQTSMTLQGIAPGVTVVQRSGQPGKDGGAIRIRGIGTLGDSNPLVLVDNVEMNINNIDPNIIESISILKDAASAAIYGSRAANGVILITTKRAKQEGYSLSYSGYTGFQQPTDLRDMVNARDHMALLNVAYVNAGRTPVFPEDLVNNYDELSKNDPVNYPDVDWQDRVYTDNGFTQSHFLNLTGGNENIKIMAGLGYFSQRGLIENTNFERFSIRVNSDIRLSERLSSRVDIFLRQMEANEPDIGLQGDYSLIYWLNRMPATQPILYPNGQYGIGWEGDNPYAMARSGYQRVLTPSVMMNLGLNYEILKGLKLDFNYAPHFWEEHSKVFHPAITTYHADGRVAYTKPQITSLSQRNDRNVAHNLRATLHLAKSFDAHNVGVLAGFQQENFSNRWFSGYRENFILPAYDVLDAGSQENQRSKGSGSDWALRSFFGRVNYNFSGKYLFEANLRYDGSSRFASGNKWGLFPSFSAGWHVSDEAFWSPLQSWMDDFKIRASWGRLGNQNIGTYPFDSFVTLNVPFVFNGTIANGAALTDMANSDITWETTEMLNFGIDANFFRKLSVTFDYYIRNTNGILLQLDVPKYLGLAAPYQNAGEVENKGWDLGLNYRNSKGEFSYDIGFVLSDVKNKVLDLKGITFTGLLVNNEGHPMNSIYALEADGFFANEDEVAAHAQQYGNYGPGDIRYVDQLTVDTNGDGVPDAADGIINDDDRKIVGNTIPRFTFGVNASISWRAFDLSVLLQGVGKADGYLYAQSVMPFFLGGTAQEAHKDYWTPENPNATFPRLVFNEPNNEKNSTFWMKNAAYMRLKNLQIGYRLPPATLEKVGIRSARLYLSGQNLFTMDDFWDGFDVEAPVGNGSYYPQVKVFTLGVDVSF